MYSGVWSGGGIERIEKDAKNVCPPSVFLKSFDTLWDGGSHLETGVESCSKQFT